MKGLSDLQQREEYDRMIREDKEREIEISKSRDKFYRKIYENNKVEDIPESLTSKMMREKKERENLKLWIDNAKRVEEEEKLLEAFIDAGWTVGRLGGRRGFS